MEKIKPNFKSVLDEPADRKTSLLLIETIKKNQNALDALLDN